MPRHVPSARRQSRTGPADDEVRDRIDVAIDVAIELRGRSPVRPIPVIPAGSRSWLYGPHGAGESGVCAWFLPVPAVLASRRLKACDAAACRPSGDDQASGCLASPDSVSLASGAVRLSNEASQDLSVTSERINQPTFVLRCAE